ncbi:MULTISPECIES: hypothetical protein [Streptomyces]|uniref:Uncharacterized protein n=1 Tax=Streptomyces albus (strain ATCC 21838 / DSM 41398 / FERM P-419 / JCM 4703 / NBRC 107858) TaxID=1081613 RepID=A0A0B5EJ09_STRA4|nr:hypothetical protein [Streptomyces sp. SCSIO ZS0520]AJE81474.1 hypothetical protein SLNWT_1098 [Streptomyces albus]AOU75789.1 hypothetical protein SLNHY_1098 [Streptomyces albus]
MTAHPGGSYGCFTLLRRRAPATRRIPSAGAPGIRRLAAAGDALPVPAAEAG